MLGYAPVRIYYLLGVFGLRNELVHHILTPNFLVWFVEWCRRFETGGVPGPTSEMLPCAPAQMGRRETEREGGRQPERERGGNPAAFVFVPRPGRVRLQ
jgi:hypothetical protein